MYRGVQSIMDSFLAHSTLLGPGLCFQTIHQYQLIPRDYDVNNGLSRLAAPWLGFAGSVIGRHGCIRMKNPTCSAAAKPRHVFPRPPHPLPLPLSEAPKRHSGRCNGVANPSLPFPHPCRNRYLPDLPDIQHPVLAARASVRPARSVPGRAPTPTADQSRGHHLGARRQRRLWTSCRRRVGSSAVEFR